MDTLELQRLMLGTAVFVAKGHSLSDTYQKLEWQLPSVDEERLRIGFRRRFFLKLSGFTSFAMMTDVRFVQNLDARTCQLLHETEAAARKGVSKTFADVDFIAEQITARGLSAIAMKGVGHLCEQYKSCPLRFMSDIDLLIDEFELDHWAKFLFESGYDIPSSDCRYAFRIAPIDSRQKLSSANQSQKTTFFAPAHRHQNVDLHWGGGYQIGSSRFQISYSELKPRSKQYIRSNILIPSSVDCTCMTMARILESSEATWMQIFDLLVFAGRSPSEIEGVINAFDFVTDAPARKRLEELSSMMKRFAAGDLNDDVFKSVLLRSANHWRNGGLVVPAENGKVVSQEIRRGFLFYLGYLIPNGLYYRSRRTNFPWVDHYRYLIAKTILIIRTKLLP